MLLRKPPPQAARALSTRAAAGRAGTAAGRTGAPPGASSNLLAYKRRLPGKKKAKGLQAVSPPLGARVSAYMMGSVHDPVELTELLRTRFAASGSVQRLNSPTLTDLDELTRADSAADDSLHDVVHLSAPALGEASPEGTPNASVFFFSGPTHNVGSCGDTCVSVFWGADPEFEVALLADLRALHQLSKSPLSQRMQLDRLAIPREEVLIQPGERTALRERGEGLLLEEGAPPAARLLDELVVSQALQRHMKLLLVENEVEELLAEVKYTVRQGLGTAISTQLRAQVFGSLQAGRRRQGSLQARMWQMREVNFDSRMVSTPDWLWDDPAREELYDALVGEYDIQPRMEAINQQLDYAEGAMTSIKEDRQHRHSLFVEYTIVLLICFEVGIELYSLGWLDPIPPPPPEPSPPLVSPPAPAAVPAEAGPQPETCLAAAALQKGEEATRQQQRQHGTRVSRTHSRQNGGERHVV